jgi:hypothetical protein
MHNHLLVICRIDASFPQGQVQPDWCIYPYLGPGVRRVMGLTKKAVSINTPPPLTNPFFARTLSYNAKVLNKPLPLTSSSSPTSPAVIAPPAAVESSANILPEPLVDQHVHMLELESLGVSRVAEPYFTVHRIGYNACIPYSLR